MQDVTIIYYTNNLEVSSFAEKIQDSILRESKGFPIVSVSQKPMTFGTNVCVGDIGASAHNAWRQLQVGCETAKTKFVCTCEADSLHHSEYFSFQPDREDIFYVASPLYVLFAQKGKVHIYYSKAPQESSIFIGREFLLKRLKTMLPKTMWKCPDDDFLNGSRLALEKIIFKLNVPVITFKTDQNMHRKTPFSRSSGTRTLPYWGSSSELVQRYS